MQIFESGGPIDSENAIDAMDPSLAVNQRKERNNVKIPRNPYSKSPKNPYGNGGSTTSGKRRTALQDHQANKNNNLLSSTTAKPYNHQESSQGGGSSSRKISPVSALKLFQQTRSRTVPVSSLHLLAPDIPWTRLDAGRIHELAGAAGTAKTQLALQLCVQCATMGYECSYASVKHVKNLSLLAHRLNQMIVNQNISRNAHEILSRIHLKGIRNADELADLQIETTQRLLVLDSVADVFRGETDYTQRALQFCQWVQTWRRDYAHCIILILNQVTMNETQPALGMTWAHCVNASFLVRRIGNDRILSLRRSPVFGRHDISFSVQTSGCRVLHE